VALSGDFEEGEAASDESALHTRMKLGAAWSFATLAGVAALACSSLVQLPPPLTMLALGVLIAAYAAYGYFAGNKDTLQFADSLYYMGFLWSLFALLAAFVIWPAPKLTADAVVTAFGYALVSTFCGMLLRLMTLQFHDTVADRVAQAQHAIDRRVAALTQEINDATTEITAFRERAANDLGSTLYDLVHSLAGVREKLIDQHLRMAKATSDGFESTLREILGRLSAIQVPQEMLTSEVAKVVASLGKQGEHFDKAAQRLEASLRHAADTVTSFGESLSGSAAAKQVGAAIQNLSSKIKERTDQFAEMTAALEKSRTDLDNQLGSLQSLGAAVSMVSGQLSAFETELKDISSASMSAELKNGLASVQKAIRSSLDASKAIESTMRDVLFFMKERVTEERSGGRN
jgi:predicted  nucleic acid-binding Zn-ribbon protein